MGKILKSLICVVRNASCITAIGLLSSCGKETANTTTTVTPPRTDTTAVVPGGGSTTQKDSTIVLAADAAGAFLETIIVGKDTTYKLTKFEASSLLTSQGFKVDVGTGSQELTFKNTGGYTAFTAFGYPMLRPNKVLRKMDKDVVASDTLAETPLYILTNLDRTKNQGANRRIFVMVNNGTAESSETIINSLQAGDKVKGQLNGTFKVNVLRS